MMMMMMMMMRICLYNEATVTDIFLVNYEFQPFSAVVRISCSYYSLQEATGFLHYYSSKAFLPHYQDFSALYLIHLI